MMKTLPRMIALAVCLLSVSVYADNDLTIESTAPCYSAGSQVTVNVVLDNVTAEVLGGLFYLQYDNTKLDFVSIVPGDLPFEVDGPETVDEGAGTISYTTTVGTPEVGDPEGYTGTGPVTMAVATFEILAGVCSQDDLVVFYEPGFPFTTRLTQPNPSGEGAIPLYPGSKSDLGAISFLMSLPSLATPSGIVQSADAGVCEWTPTAGDIVAPTSQDACGTVLVPVGERSDSLALDAAYPVGQTTITWSVEDCAGQTTSVTQVVTVHDEEAPEVETGVIDDCYPSFAEAEAAAIAATTASDNCTATPVLTASTEGDCEATITVTATDGAGNYSSTTYQTRVDNTPPAMTKGSISACFASAAEAEAAAIAATTVVDNCTASPDVVAVATGTCNAVVTVTATDECGNSADVQYNTVIDSESPQATAGTIDDCYASRDDAKDAAIAATTASDNCTSELTMTAVVDGTCNATVTVTVSDDCGNSTQVEYYTTIDGEDPQVSVSPIADCYASVAEAEAAAIGATTATDNCSADPEIVASTVGTCDAQITVTVTDDCGNSTQVQYSTRIDGEAPQMTAGTIADCYATVAEAEAAAILATQVTDNCTAATLVSADTLGTCNAVITVTAEDECGNTASVQYTTTIDGDAPEMTAGTIDAYYASAAEAEAAAVAATTVSDACDANPVITAATEGECEATITVTATDACGNQAYVEYYTSVDATPPVLTCTGYVEATGVIPGTCFADVIVPPATATDNCGGEVTITFVRSDGELTLDAPYPVGDTTITWTAVDAAGNDPTCDTVVHVEDNEAPVVEAGTIADCYDTDDDAIDAAIAATTMSDNCTDTIDLIVSTTIDTVAGCDVLITVYVEDESTNESFVQYTTRVDADAPEVQDCPADITVLADAGGCGAVVEWDEPTASDSCGTVSVASSHEPGDTFPAGTTTVTYTFTDECGHESTCSFDVTVEAFVEFAATVQIQGSIADDLTRCITFTFCKSDDTTVEYQTEMDFNYNTGVGSILISDLPCGDYTCVTAQDMLHTLTVRLDLGDGFEIVGTGYEATFTGANRLLQGDLFDDTATVGVDFIDVVDIGVYIAVWGAEYDSNGDSYPDGNTPCGMYSAHADIDGDGLIDTSDYAFITTNYELVGDMLCCVSRQTLDGPQPRESITNAELRAMGLDFVTRADLNHDGKVDGRDVRAFSKGVRPGAGATSIHDTREFNSVDVMEVEEKSVSRTFRR